MGTKSQPNGLVFRPGIRPERSTPTGSSWRPRRGGQESMSRNAWRISPADRPSSNVDQVLAKRAGRQTPAPEVASPAKAVIKMIGCDTPIELGGLHLEGHSGRHVQVQTEARGSPRSVRMIEIVGRGERV